LHTDAAIVFTALTCLLVTLASILLVAHKHAIALLAYSLIPISGLLIFMTLVYPSLDWRESKNLSLLIRNQLNGNHKLAIYNLPKYAPLFYTDGLTEVTPEGYIDPIESAPQLYKYVQRKKSASLLIDNSELEWLQRDDVLQIKDIFRGQQLSIV